MRGSPISTPLYGSTAIKESDVPPPERVVAEALPLARREPSVARALPVALYRSRKRLDFSLLTLTAAFATARGTFVQVSMSWCSRSRCT